MQVGFLICEDMWDQGYDIHPGAELRAAGAQLLVCTAATPYRQGIMQERLFHARRQGCPLVHVNLCGANDELIFDGRSFAIDQHGNLISQLNAFAEQVQVIDLDTTAPIEPKEINLEHERFNALTLGVRDFVEKNHLPRAFISLSGGIDSSVVAVIAAEALGPERVTAVAIPSRYTDPRSTECARLLALRLGIGFQVVELEGLHKAAESSLAALIDEGTTAENIQARLRAMIMMSFVNRYGGLLLNASNKTELALGYATLYGDTAGTLCPIADLTKPQIYALARWINRESEIIPTFTMERPPSAELRPDQVDPFDYPKVAPVMEQLVQDNQSNPVLRNSEHKRWQFGVVLKISKKAFGTGRMIPITRR
jgi:NAD+ synthase (glutamine-hydrolysing)